MMRKEMDINMKDIMLSKENDSWIYINEMVNGVKTPTTKIAYDYETNPNFLENIKNYFSTLANNAGLDYIDDVAGTADWLMIYESTI